MKKYVIFKLGNSEYGVNINEVNSIERISEVVKIPNSRPFVKGYVTYRDKVTLTIDLKRYLLNEDVKINNNIRMLFLNIDENNYLGLIIEEANEVIEFSESDIQLIDTPIKLLDKLEVANLDSRLIIILPLVDMITKSSKYDPDYKFDLNIIQN